MVFVQPSAYGRDNACMLDAMRQIGTGCKGIVDIDENISDAEIARLNDAGVRGVRINVSPVSSGRPKNQTDRPAARATTVITATRSFFTSSLPSSRCGATKPQERGSRDEHRRV